MKSFLLLILLLFAANISMRAQTTGTLFGRVMDQRNEPIAGATIIVLGRSPLPATTTKSDGTYLVVGIQAGTYVIRTQIAGFETRQQDTVVILADQATRLNIRLRALPPIPPKLGKLTAGNGAGKNARGLPIVVNGRHLGPNIRWAIAHAGGINTIGQNCCGLLRPPMITYVPYRVPEEGWRRLTGGGKTASVQTKVSHPSPGAMGFQIRGTRGETELRVDGVKVSDPFQGGFGATNSVYYPTYSIVSPSKSPEAENSRNTGGFEPEYGDVVDIRPEEIGTNAITPSEYYRVTGGNPYNITDSPLTSLMQSLNDPFSADAPFHRRGSFPRRRSSTFH
ncbi:MAG: carboxypeptidase-like regulatory domain-containing protein [Candidatus Kapaibacterium sp.]